MPRRKFTVSVSVDPIRANNPVEKWRKEHEKTAPEMAELLEYSSVDGYHKFVRCASAPLDRLSKASKVSGIDLKDLVDYYAKHGRRAS